MTKRRFRVLRRKDEEEIEGDRKRRITRFRIEDIKMIARKDEEQIQDN